MLRSIKCTRYVKGVLLLTPNTVQGGGGSTWSTFSSPKTQSVPNVLTRIVACEQALRLALKVDVREARERRRRTRRCRGGGGGVGGGGGPTLARSRRARPNTRACSQASSHLEWHMLLPELGLWFLPGEGGSTATGGVLALLARAQDFAGMTIAPSTRTRIFQNPTLFSHESAFRPHGTNEFAHSNTAL